MANLITEQKTILELFSDKKSKFLIPDYQRPYAWGDNECQTLWDDVFAFAIPENDVSKFDTHDEYFLGPIVTFKNSEEKLEVIDGQQRLTTLLLLLRAFYSHFGKMKDAKSEETRKNIAKCIWETDEFDEPNTDKIKIDSEVFSEDYRNELITILKTGATSSTQKSKYAENYSFFMDKIDEFLSEFPTYFAYLPNRLMKNCILLPIEADSQDTALRIFSTLNDRGKPLSDTDIFKAQLYKYYSDKGQKDQFINRWKVLEETCDRIFKSQSDSPMDELFTRYMYYARAKQGIKQSTVEGLRKFYERNKYELLKNDKILNNLELLATFWELIEDQDECFSDEVLKQLSILSYAPNSMWTYMLSAYFMTYKNEDNKLDNDKLYLFLDKIIAFIWLYAVMRPGLVQLRTPVFNEMIKLVNGEEINFSDYKFDESQIRKMFTLYEFTNLRPITKSMLVWWCYTYDSQVILPADFVFDIEHIFAKQREKEENILTNKANLESLGNKILLEKSINIRASDFRFKDKKRRYEGYELTNGKKKPGSIIYEFKELIQEEDFTESDIENRKNKIIEAFIEFLKKNQLVKPF